jgi:hypothetical protein
MSAEERYRKALEQIAREESGIWGTIAREALKEPIDGDYHRSMGTLATFLEDMEGKW